MFRRSLTAVVRGKLSRRFLSAETKNDQPNTFGETQIPTVTAETKRNNALIGITVAATAASIYMMGIYKLKKVIVFRYLLDPVDCVLG